MTCATLASFLALIFSFRMLFFSIYDILVKSLKVACYSPILCVWYVVWCVYGALVPLWTYRCQRTTFGSQSSPSCFVGPEKSAHVSGFGSKCPFPLNHLTSTGSSLSLSEPRGVMCACACAQRLKEEAGRPSLSLSAFFSWVRVSYRAWS